MKPLQYSIFSVRKPEYIALVLSRFSNAAIDGVKLIKDYKSYNNVVFYISMKPYQYKQLEEIFDKYERGQLYVNFKKYTSFYRHVRYIQRTIKRGIEPQLNKVSNYELGGMEDVR